MKGTKFWHRELSVIPLASIGDNCTIHAHVWIGELAIIGNNVKIQAFAFIPNGVIIEDNVFIGPHVCFTNDKHPPSQGNSWDKTVVKEGVSIGAGSVILPGIIIGNNARIGAGSVVTKDVPPNSLVYGNPARVVYQQPTGIRVDPNDDLAQ